MTNDDLCNACNGYIFDRQGNPISVEEFAARVKVREYKIVEHTKVGAVLVSTCWLGIDHGDPVTGRLIFETMTFGEGSSEDDIKRYATEEEARAGHEDTVREVEARLKNPSP